jgi:hypothetical protein
MSSLTTGKSQPEGISPATRIAAIFAIDAICVVAMLWAAFSDGMAGWAGEYAKPHPPVPLSHWVLLAVGIVLAIHAMYAYWRWWIPDAGFQGIAAIVALVVAFGLLTSPGGGAANPNHPTPVSITQTNGGDFCYSGGQCYINGVPVSGHP